MHPDAFPTALQHVKATATVPGVVAIVLPALILYGTNPVPFFSGGLMPEVCLQVHQLPACKSPMGVIRLSPMYT